MTFNSNNFVKITQPRRINIANVDGITYLVIGVGTIILSLSLSPFNTLMVSSFLNKLMSVG